MKRKLDTNDQPNLEIPNNSQETVVATSFENFGLDSRLLQAVAKTQFTSPTPVQQNTIPPALEGKDVLAKSGTGSGKTAAYVLPIIQNILNQKSTIPKSKSIRALILVPTRELAEQVHKSFVSFAQFCSKDVRSVNISQRASDAVIGALLQDSPDIVVSTPGRASQFLSTGHLILGSLKILVIDEADLVLSYGYEDDVTAISQLLPQGIQTFLMSATLTTEVEGLKKTFCRDPIVVSIEENDQKVNKLNQYMVKCGEDEKFLLIFVIFKLKLVLGKCIVFVAGVDRSYRLKLYLDQFGIKSCILNSELPVNSRLHAVQEFNKGLYQILIAADDQEVLGGINKLKNQDKAADTETNVNGNQALQDTDDEETSSRVNIRPVTKTRREYGISRGIDFQNVACVINFDLPTSSKSYTHRIGRTARAGKTGMALSFVIPKDKFGKHKPTSVNTARHDEKVLERIKIRQAEKGRELEDYHFDMAQVEGFRYRMNDALRAVTKTAVQEARAREIKQELLKSEKLRKHFEDNPADLQHLRSDSGHGAVIRVQPHLKHVPDYLLPSKGKQNVSNEETGFVSFKKREDHQDKRRQKTNVHKKRSQFRKAKTGKVDPLKSFRAK